MLCWVPSGACVVNPWGSEGTLPHAFVTTQTHLNKVSSFY